MHICCQSSTSDGLPDLSPRFHPRRRRSFQALGLAGLGFSQGFERLHYLLDAAFEGDQLSYRFKKVGGQ